MKLLSSFLLLFFLSVTAAAQKVVNDPNVEVRSVSSFHAIDISHAFDVILTQSSEEAVAVSASNREDLPTIKTRVDNGVLKIYFESSRPLIGNNLRLRAYVSVKNLDAFDASGASTIDVDGTLTSSNLRISLAGASDFSGKLAVSGKLTVNLNGASDVKLSGSATELQATLRGASEMKGYDFSAASVHVDGSGASRVQLTADKELSASLSGASSVHYKGSAVVREVRTSGASNVKKKED